MVKFAVQKSIFDLTVWWQALKLGKCIVAAHSKLLLSESVLLKLLLGSDKHREGTGSDKHREGATNRLNDVISCF